MLTSKNWDKEFVIVSLCWQLTFTFPHLLCQHPSLWRSLWLQSVIFSPPLTEDVLKRLCRWPAVQCSLTWRCHILKYDHDRSFLPVKFYISPFIVSSPLTLRAFMIRKCHFLPFLLVEDLFSKKRWCKPSWVLFGVAVFLVVWKRNDHANFSFIFHGWCTPFFNFYFHGWCTPS